MSNCTPCTPANDELPIFCDPFPATDTAKRLLVEDEAFCQKALNIPTTPNQILKTNSIGNIQWGTLDSVLQSGPVDLGSQPLTTTGSVYCKLLDVTNASGSAAIEVGGSTNSYIDLKNPSSDDFDVRLGTIGGTSGTLETGNNQPLAIYAGSGNVNIQPFGNGRVGIGTSSPQSLLHLTGTAGQANVVTLLNTANAVGEQGMRVAFDANPARLTIQRASDAGAFEANHVSVMQDTGNVGINTIAPAAKFHVNGTVRLQGLPIYANNAAAIAGGLVVDDVYKTATGELRIVV